METDTHYRISEYNSSMKRSYSPDGKSDKSQKFHDGSPRKRLRNNSPSETDNKNNETENIQQEIEQETRQFNEIERSPKAEQEEELIVLDEVEDDDPIPGDRAEEVEKKVFRETLHHRRKDAAEIIKEKRRESYVHNLKSRLATGFLFTDELDHLYQHDLQDLMLEKYVGGVEHKLPREDAIRAEKFLQLNDEGSMDDLTLDGNSLSSYLPSGQPLLEYIKADTWPNGPGWKYPDLSVFPMKKEWGLLTNQTRKEVQSMGITIASHMPDMPEFMEFVQDNIKQTQEAFPVGFVALHCECVTVSAEEYKSNLLDQPEKLRVGDTITISLAQENTATLPVGIVFGDGINWMATIRLPIVYENTESQNGKQVTFKVFNADPQMRNLLELLPTLVGRGISTEEDIFTYFMRMYHIKAKLPPIVDIGALALVCGWDISKTDLFSLHLAVTGKILNMKMSARDSVWFLSLRKMNMALMTCMIGNIMSSYLITAAFLTLLVRNLFPDPEVLCFALELKQGHAFSWVAGMILNSLDGLSPLPAVMRDTSSRYGLAISLECNDKDPGLPTKAVLLAKLIQTWPHITGGGPRFLHNVRFKFVDQFKILQELSYKHPSIPTDIDKVIMDRDWMNKIMYREEPLDLSIGHPVEELGLLCHPDLERSLLKLYFDPDGAIKVTRIIKVGKNILEYARLNPSKINEILRLLAILPLDTKEYNDWKQKPSTYERLRMMHYFLYDQHAIRVEEIDLEIKRKWKRCFESQANPKGEVTKEHQLRAQYMLIQQRKCFQGVSSESGALDRAYKIIPTSDKNKKLCARRGTRRSRMYKGLKDNGVRIVTPKTAKYLSLPSANHNNVNLHERVVGQVRDLFESPCHSMVKEVKEKCLDNTISDDDEVVMIEDPM